MLDLRRTPLAASILLGLVAVACGPRPPHRADPMPRIEHAGPLSEIVRAMVTDRPNLFARADRYDDHVRVWFSGPDGAGKVADFGASLDGRNLFLEHFCPTAGLLPAPVPEGEEPPELMKRVLSFVKKKYEGLGEVERAVWLGRYRNIHLVEYFPTEAGSTDYRATRVTAAIIAADEGFSRELGDVCLVPPREVLLDGHHQVIGEPLELQTEGLGAWADPAVRQPILEAALAAALRAGQ